MLFIAYSYLSLAQEMEVVNVNYLEGGYGSSITGLEETKNKMFIIGKLGGADGSVRLNNQVIRRGSSFVVATSKTGDFLWKRILYGATPSFIKANEDHGIFISGRVGGRGFAVDEDSKFEKKDIGDNSLFLVKLSLSGEVLWTKFFGGPASTNARKMNVDGDGNIYLSGDYRDVFKIDGKEYSDKKIKFGNGYIGSFLIKINRSGELEWAGNDFPVQDFKITPNKEILLAASFTDSITINGTLLNGEEYPLGFVVKMDSSGKVIWYHELSSKGKVQVRSLSSNHEKVFLVGEVLSDSLKIGNRILTTPEKSGYFYLTLSSQGEVLNGEILGTDLGFRFTSSGILDNDENIFFKGTSYRSGLLIPRENSTIGEPKSRPYSLIIKFSEEGEVLDSFDQKEGVVLTKGQKNRVWLISGFRDSLIIKNHKLVIKDSLAYSFSAFSQISGAKDFDINGSIGNSSSEKYSTKEIWVSDTDEIDRYGMIYKFPFQEYGILGKIEEVKSERGILKTIKGGHDISELIQVQRKHKPRSEDGYRLGKRMEGFYYDKKEYQGGYVISLVGGAFEYSGTALLWKKIENQYKLIAVYPDFLSGGLYATPVLEKESNKENLIIINAIGIDAEDKWGVIQHYKIVDERLQLVHSERVRDHNRFEE